MEKNQTVEENTLKRVEKTIKRKNPKNNNKREPVKQNQNEEIRESKNVVKKETKKEGRIAKDSIEKRENENKKRNTPKFEFKKDNLKIIPLGGLDEIGKNITVFEYGNEIVLVDCG